MISSDVLPGVRHDIGAIKSQSGRSDVTTTAVGLRAGSHTKSIEDSSLAVSDDAGVASSFGPNSAIYRANIGIYARHVNAAGVPQWTPE